MRSPRKPTRKISKIPFKVLDAPELQDDFYLNLVDWSSLNVLSVGLGTCVYLWSACTSQVGAPERVHTCVCVVGSGTREPPGQALCEQWGSCWAWIVPRHPFLLPCLLRVQTIPAPGWLLGVKSLFSRLEHRAPHPAVTPPPLSGC